MSLSHHFKLGFELVPIMSSSYEFSAISLSRVEEMSSGIEEMEAELNTEGCMRVQDFSLCIAKISQGLRKFRNHSKNFAIPAKFHYAQFFAIIAKVTMHSENLNFRYALYFRYGSEIHYA